MPPQVSKEAFESALNDLGIDPKLYKGQKMTLSGMCELYELAHDVVLDAIKHKHIAAHYDYYADTIWVDALDAAHFFYCIRSESSLYADT